MYTHISTNREINIFTNSCLFVQKYKYLCKQRVGIIWDLPIHSVSARVNEALKQVLHFQQCLDDTELLGTDCGDVVSSSTLGFKGLSLCLTFSFFFKRMKAICDNADYISS